jgi:hypothetical protein
VAANVEALCEGGAILVCRLTSALQLPENIGMSMHPDKDFKKIKVD